MLQQARGYAEPGIAANGRRPDSGQSLESREGGAALLALLVVGAALPVAAADLAGSEDHPLICRFPGSKIIGYRHADWEQTQFPSSAATDTTTSTFRSPVNVEGAITRIVYLAPVGKSPLEVFRNYQTALLQAGLKQNFACDGNCGDLYFRWRFGNVRASMRWAVDGLPAADEPSRVWPAPNAITVEDGRALYGTLSRDGREVHILVYTSIAGYRPVNAAATIVEIAEPKAMLAGQVTVDAGAITKGLAAEGKIALYGL
jgi:OOP family OmpA-OmpF porin